MIREKKKKKKKGNKKKSIKKLAITLGQNYRHYQYCEAKTTPINYVNKEKIQLPCIRRKQLEDEREEESLERRIRAHPNFRLTCDGEQDE